MSKSSKKKFLEFVKSPTNVGRILVIRNGMVGDTVFVTPVLRRLKDNFPNARLDFATSSRSLPLLRNYRCVNVLHPIPTKYSVIQHSKFFLSLRRHRYDIVVVQEVNSHYTVMAKLVKGKFTVGFENDLSLLQDFPVTRPFGVHAALAELETVKAWTNPVTPPATELPVDDADVQEGRDILKACGVTNPDAVICIHPGCSSRNSDKEWKIEHYSELADLLLQNRKVEIVFEGVSSEEAMIEQIRSRMKYRSCTLAGKTDLRQLLSVLRNSHLVIGPDTGTMHLANAVGTPVVMLFGRTDPVDTGPFDPTGRSKYVRADLSCIGCIHRTPTPGQWETCKYIRPVLCMEKLSPEMVYRAALEVLNGKS